MIKFIFILLPVLLQGQMDSSSCFYFITYSMERNIVYKIKEKTALNVSNSHSISFYDPVEVDTVCYYRKHNGFWESNLNENGLYEKGKFVSPFFGSL